MRIGLRVDADTLTGTREGIPSLLRLLDRRGVRASFFFSVGPDNMGRHLWRLVRPAFLGKMVRTGAARLYGCDILLRGVVFPGPRIGARCGEMIRAVARAGHEIGLHAWDHHRWQVRVERMDRTQIRLDLLRAYEEISRVAGAAPTCSAVPGWRCTGDVLLEKEAFPFHYNSDCRGTTCFRPVLDGVVLRQPQIPVTLPTYDEMVGREGVTGGNFNECLLARLRPGVLNVLGVHAESEGRSCLRMFDAFIGEVRSRGFDLVPLGGLLPGREVPPGGMAKRAIPGREGWLAVQERPAFNPDGSP